MKKKAKTPTAALRIAGIIVFAAITAFGMAACGEGSGLEDPDDIDDEGALVMVFDKGAGFLSDWGGARYAVTTQIYAPYALKDYEYIIVKWMVAPENLELVVHENHYNFEFNMDKANYSAGDICYVPASAIGFWATYNEITFGLVTWGWIPKDGDYKVYLSNKLPAGAKRLAQKF
ncbi:MAG: hypothetical protein LBH43_06970 [Treponema sp.]|jgi:hypothetical protein|nr:hypothetical protein [Treponema sp.]